MQTKEKVDQLQAVVQTYANARDKKIVESFRTLDKILKQARGEGLKLSQSCNNIS